MSKFSNSSVQALKSKRLLAEIKLDTDSCFTVDRLFIGSNGWLYEYIGDLDQSDSKERHHEFRTVFSIDDYDYLEDDVLENILLKEYLRR